jgi:hypothetical protein
MAGAHTSTTVGHPSRSRFDIIEGMRDRASLVVLLTVLVLGACGDVKSFPDAGDTVDAPGDDGGQDVDAPPGSAHLTIDRTSADLGSVVVGQTSAAATFLIGNDGDAASGPLGAVVTGAGYMTSTNNCTGTLAPNSSCTVSVVVTPSAAGTATGTITVTASPGGSVMASLTATALAQGALTITPSDQDFGIVVGGMASTATMFAVQNTGGGATGTVAVTLGGSDAGEFEITTNGCTGTLAGGASCIVQARFAPGVSATGSRSASLTAMASPGGAAVATLRGTAQAPATISLGGSGAFGDVLIGSPATRTITVTNNGQQTSGALTVTRSGANSFSILTGMAGDCVSGSTTLAGSASCNVRVQFNPSASGAASGTLQVSASPGGSPSTALTGNGINPATLSQNISNAAFGQVEVGVLSSTTATWTISNTGSVASSVPVLNLSTAEIEASGSTCGASIGPGGNCSMTLRFRPSTGGARSGTATLSITGSSVMLTASATGMWRVTVTRSGNSGTITSTPSGLSCAPPATSCTALFAPGAITLQARTTNGSGHHFASWSGTSAGSCNGTPARDCVVTVDGAEAVTGTFSSIGANLVFVSSATLATTLGSAAAYDTQCNQLASAAGINNAAGNNFNAWISSTTSNALTRLGTAPSGWIRMDGRVWASNRQSLLGQAILNPVRFDENGVERDVNVMTATYSDGSTSTTQTCNDWTTTSSAVGLLLGGSMGGPDAWSSDTGSTCGGGPQRVLCIMKQFNTTVTPASFAGKRVWLSNNPFSTATGATPDSVCNGDRPAGVPSGAALIARTTASGASLLGMSQMYVRPDGQEVGTGAEMIARLQRGGIWQAGNGTYVTTNNFVWTGSTAIDQAGTAASTCSNWTSTSGNGQVAYHVRARTWFWSFTSIACNATGFQQPRLYCYQP